MIIFCPVTRKVRSQRGGWCTSSEEAGSLAVSSLVEGKLIKSSK